MENFAVCRRSLPMAKARIWNLEFETLLLLNCCYVYVFPPLYFWHEFYGCIPTIFDLIWFYFVVKRIVFGVGHFRFQLKWFETVAILHIHLCNIYIYINKFVFVCFVFLDLLLLWLHVCVRISVMCVSVYNFNIMYTRSYFKNQLN